MPPPRRLRTTLGRTFPWLAIGGLGLVLALVAAIAVDGALTGSRATEDVRRSGDLTGAYLRAQEAFSREDAIEDLAKDDYQPGLPETFESAASQLDAALDVIARAGGADDRALVRRVRPLHGEYAAAMRRIFEAAATGAGDAAEEINDEAADPAQDALQPLLDGAGPEYAAEQQREIDQLEGTQSRILDRTLVVVPLGVVLYLLLLGLFLGLRRRLDRALRRELAASQGEARTDELTGLGNRRQFREWLDAWHAGAPGAPDGFTLMMLDVDRFKEINDTLGHAVGDALLRRLAARLHDALPPGSRCARLGGDEFVLLVATSSPAEAERAAVELRAATDAPFEIEGLLLHVVVSVGVALHLEDRPDGATLMRQADLAMYAAKATGRGVELFSGSDRLSRERVVLAGELRAALDDGSLVLHYQPQAELTTGGVAAVKALVRWQHPTRGLLSPAEFLPLAEEHGLMARLTLRVLDVAAAQAAAWEREGRSLRVSVNLAPANLLDSAFPDQAAAILERHDVAPEALELEITEDTILVDPERVLDVVARLSEQGFSFTLDDFGTGYSSLAYLKRLPIRELKIDRSFIVDMDRNAEDDVIVRSTIDMARRLGLRVVAEGVETAGTWDRLRDAGCDGAQGYLLSPPLTASELAAWLDRRSERAALDAHLS